MKTRATRVWHDATTAALNELWPTHDAADIAHRLGVSEGAVLIKAYKLGLPTRNSGRMVRVRGQLMSQTTGKPFVGNRAFRNEAHDGQRSPAVPLLVSNEIAGVSFLDREPGECAWPIGDPLKPDFGCCGETSVPDKPYCPRHMAIAYQPASPDPENHEVSRLNDNRKRAEARQVNGRDTEPTLVDIFGGRDD